MKSPETPSPAGNNETHFPASRGVSADSRGFADVLVVATSEGMLNRLQEERGDGEVGLTLIYLRRAWELADSTSLRLQTISYLTPQISHHKEETLQEGTCPPSLTGLIHRILTPLSISGLLTFMATPRTRGQQFLFALYLW